ncbi:hypothetical protein ACFSTH_11565 [Paenibacillus yanchengensis]|uniref:Aminomethyltransferase folate-binding domain-containing protein n=1 Tax=Paenibacillus yanchengensis TaxID=2035833 RepID=A0ABW4YIR9_9BACL
MRINLLKEGFIEDNDVYVLECLQETVIVNNNYLGINLYNKNLEQLKSINIFEGILIHTVFKHPYKNEVILYCPDNQVFVYLNLEKSFQKVVNFIGNMDEYGLSSVYFWSGNEVLFFCGNKKYYRIKIGFFSLKEIDLLELEKEYPTFYTMLNNSSKYLLHEGGTEILTYEDRINNEIIYLNYKNNVRIASKIPNKLGHEVMHLDNGLFLSVHEEFIQGIREGVEVTIIESVPPYTIFKARKQNEQNTNFIVLSGNKSNSQQCILSRYEVEY